MRQLLRVLAAVLVIGAATGAAAQDYPNKPIRLVVGYPPGGAVDLIARTVAHGLTERLGQNVIVDNRPGSGGNFSADAVARAPADGYTLLHGPDNLFVVNPHIYSRMPADPLTAFVPIAPLIRNQLVLAVNPSFRANDFRGFIAAAKAAKEPHFYASIGNGSLHHLAMELLKRTAGINLVHVPYKGGGPAGMAVVAGEVPMMFGGASVVPLIKAGKLRGLAVSGLARSDELPELPAIREIYPSFVVTIWHGLFAPAGTPQPILDRLRGAVEAVMAQPEVRERLRKSGAGEPHGGTPQEFAAEIRRDYDTYGKLIKEIGLKID
jgi:tripartite-type tricarboxylate transporter receptor subunit TctC